MDTTASLFHTFLNHFLLSPPPPGGSYAGMLSILQQVVEGLQAEPQCEAVIQAGVHEFFNNAANQAAMRDINSRQFATPLVLHFATSGRPPIAIPMKELFSSHDHNRELYAKIWVTWYKLGQITVPALGNNYSDQLNHIRAMIPPHMALVSSAIGDDTFNIKGLMEIGPQVLGLVSKVIPALASFDASNALGKVEEALINLLSQTDVPNAREGTALIMQGLRLLSQPSVPNQMNT